MISVIIPNWFGIEVENGHARMEFDGAAVAHIQPRRINAFLAGQVIQTGASTACLTKNRLVITMGGDCSVILFPQPLLDEFIGQLDSMDEARMDG